MRFHRVLGHTVDRLVRPEIYIGERPWSSFQVCGCAGLALAILLALTLVINRDLLTWILAGIVLTAVLTFLGLAMLTKIITGEEKLVYYHHEITVMVATAVLLWMLHQPILLYLDITILGVGMFLACGRVGCFMVGCCHGRPHRWGVCYREEHATAGFASYLVGVRLFPIQAVESLWVLGSVLVGSALILGGRPPGEALAWYIITYGIGRFCFEFMRGDPDRPYRWGFSEAQWTSLLLMMAVVGAELAAVLLFHPWHVVATVDLMLIMVTLTFGRRFRAKAKYQLLRSLMAHPNLPWGEQEIDTSRKRIR